MFSQSNSPPPKSRKAKSFSGLSNYSLSIFISLIVGCIFTGLLIWLQAFGILFNQNELLERFAEVLLGILLTSQIISGASYISKFFDPLTHNTNILMQIEYAIKKLFFPSVEPQLSRKRELNYQWAGLTCGLTISFLLSAIELALHITTPFIGPFSKFMGENAGSLICSTALIIFNASTFGGWGNRTGRFLDYCKKYKDDTTARSFFYGKDINYTLSIAAGILIGIILTAVILTLSTGIFTASTFIGVGPAWIGIGIFACTMVSTSASCCGYIGRVFDFILGENSLISLIFKPKNKDIENTAPNKIKEEHTSSTSFFAAFQQRINPTNIGTVVGVAIGLGIGITLIACGILTLPIFGLGLPKIFFGVSLILSFGSSCGGAGNRIGEAVGEFIYGSETDLEMSPLMSGHVAPRTPSFSNNFPSNEPPQQSTITPHQGPVTSPPRPPNKGHS